MWYFTRVQISLVCVQLLSFHSIPFSAPTDLHKLLGFAALQSAMPVKDTRHQNRTLPCLVILGLTCTSGSGVFFLPV